MTKNMPLVNKVLRTMIVATYFIEWICVNV